MASSPPIVSEASLTTLHHILSCFLEPCPPGTSAVGAAKVYWHQISLSSLSLTPLRDLPAAVAGRQR